MKKRLFDARLFSQSVLALSIAAAGPAVAQVAAPVDSGLEEIVVTAQHRQESLQDTEISISAFSADTLRDLGITNAGEIGNYTPNVTMSPQIGGRSGFSVNIRGVRNGESVITFEPSIGLYMDGVLIAKNVGSLLDVMDMERIEVLRGPQGTLYGRNTIGGAINVITKRPTDEFEGRVEATLGSESQQDFKGMLNVPLLGTDSPVGSLTLRASAASLQRDGLYDNDYVNAPQDELQERDREVGLAHLLWQPTDALDVMYSYDRTEHDEAPIPMFVTFVNTAVRNPAPNLIAPFLADQGDRPSSGSFDNDYIGETTVEGHSLHVDFEICEGLAFSSISGYREMENAGSGDNDGSPYPLLWTEDYQENDVLTQEFRLIGEAFDARLDYVLGAFYLDESGDVDQSTYLDESVARSLPVLRNVPYRSQTVTDFQTETWALYTQATYALTDRWDVTAGIRYTEEERDMSKTDFLSISGRLARTTLFPDANKEFDNVSPMGSVSYDWSEDIMTYFKVSAGYQSGGFNPRDTSTAGFPIGFDEEDLISYEIGWKSTLADQRVRLNGAVFFSDYDDKQVNIFATIPVPRSTIRNAGVVEIWGAEVELLAQLTEHAEVGVDYGYTDPEYKELEDEAGRDLSNSNFPFTPEHNAHAYFTYEFPRLSVGALSARVDWSYKDAMTFLVPVPEPNSEGSYDLWDARLTLSEIAGPGDSSMRVSLWGKNLADEEYWNFGVNLYNGQGWTINGYGEERTYGVDLAIEF